MKASTLLALTASALALPGIAPVAHADAPPAESTIGYRISTYEEDDLPKSALLSGSLERYDITVNQLQWVTPIGGNYSVSLRGSHESMSGASPWYTLATPARVAVVMSGATISEDRTDINASGRRYLDNGTVGLSVGYSDENDYESLSGGLDAERHFNDNLTTLAGGFSFSSDDISPTDADIARYRRVKDASKQSRSVFVAVSQVLNQNSVIQTGLSYTHLSGYLTDPYKLYDVRPDSRSQFAWTTAWRQFIPVANAALHADYRFYHDDFGINSHTLELEWYQNFGDNWRVVPGLRYYTQSAADFFRPGNIITTQPRSSDYRLSAYGAVSGGLKVQVDIDKFTLSLAGERYHSSDKFATWEGDSSPALVDFTRLSLGIDYRY